MRFIFITWFTPAAPRLDRCALGSTVDRDVRVDGGAVNARDSLGWAYLRLDDASRALKAFDAAVAIRPLPMALYGRALAQRRLGNEEAARSDLEAARKQRRRIDEEVRKQGLPVAADAPTGS